MAERNETPPKSICKFYDQGACHFLDRYPSALAPLLARVRRPHREKLMSILEGGLQMAEKRNYDCQARFSLNPEGFQRANCREYVRLLD